VRKEIDPWGYQVVERMRELGVGGVVLDLDDTLIYTSEIFTMQMRLYAQAVAGGLGLDANKVFEILSRLNNESYLRYGVNPDRWYEICMQLARELGDDALVAIRELEILTKIYSIVPRVQEGVMTQLSVLDNARIPIGLVTHANEEWTMWKLRQTGLDRFVSALVIANENDHKGPGDWRMAIKLLDLSARDVVVCGDNLRGDVIAAFECGVFRGVLLPSPWEVFRKEQLPPGIEAVDRFGQFFEALLRF